MECNSSNGNNTYSTEYNTIIYILYSYPQLVKIFIWYPSWSGWNCHHKEHFICELVTAVKISHELLTTNKLTKEGEIVNMIF